MRDDLPTLPLPPEAKAYARRRGLKAMERQPQSYINMVAAVTNQRGQKRGFKNRDGAGAVPHAFKECLPGLLRRLIEGDEDDAIDALDSDKFLYPEASHNPLVFQVRPESLDPRCPAYLIEVPSPVQSDLKHYVNYCTVSQHGVRLANATDVTAIIKQRMAHLAANRDYPAGAVFDTPFGRFAIRDKKIEEL